MELPAALRAAIDRELEGVALTELQRAADRLSMRYRAELRDGRLHVPDTLTARAYLATRLPATYAAIRAGLESAAELMPAFAPRTLLDVGAGPGTAMWAVADCWPGLETAALFEASAAMRALGGALAGELGLNAVEWFAGDAARGLDEAPAADLVTLAYVLDELPQQDRDGLVAALWDRTDGLLVIVEPGTPAGWKRILAARSLLTGRGATIVAPCPHPHPCPVVSPDWCHFARRVARSRLHRQTKRGEAPFEDEKFVYLAASRQPPTAVGARVLAPPATASGQVALKLCRADGRLEQWRVSRRDGDAFRRARRAGWGDALPADGAEN